MTTLRPNALLMVRPYKFGFNVETSGDNVFQQASDDATIPARALAEFDTMTATLERADIETVVVQDTPEPHTPDSIFPNNWASYHPDGTLVLYPMFAANRRQERHKRVLPTILGGYATTRVIDLCAEDGPPQHYLEGTGSIIYDHTHRTAYAAYSKRTDKELFEQLCNQLDYTSVGFEAKDSAGVDIYHTNVMMSVAENYAVVCIDALRQRSDRIKLIDRLHDTGKRIIPISESQMRSFAGNILQIYSRDGSPFTLMSSTAYKAFSREQLDVIAESTLPLVADVSTIERQGGGSVRCMVSEVYLSPK